ncbi:MAG: hypothetical protein J6I40_06195 [Mailhella sp.]|nr:hypothetical protein [Mailhella sp.]
MLTHAEYFYDLPPEKAVVAAYYQYEKHNWNTWEYDWSLAKETPWFWNCGNMGCYKY